jgi:hypothetical protein
MTRYWPWIACVVGIVACFGCHKGETLKPSYDTTTVHEGFWELCKPTEEKFIRVSTADEFIAGIGPNRTLELAPGVYVLSDVRDRNMEYVRWDPYHDGNTVTIRNVENMKIVGKGTEPVRLVVHPSYVFVLNFENCKNIELENLVLGHFPEGFCTGGVIRLKHCIQFSLRRCDLFGCGTEGLALQNVHDFYFDYSVIRDCSYGIMRIFYSSNLHFTESTFIRNQEFYGINLNDSKGILFDGCTISNNMLNEELFHITSCSDIVVKGGVITDNEFKSLTNSTLLHLTA